MKNKLVMTLLAILICTPIFAHSLSQPKAILMKSQQMLLVISPSWDSPTGTLQRYQRDHKTHHWKVIGNAIPVVIGKNGMGWGIDMQIKSINEPVKAEGDGRTPVGIYKIGPSFGFNEKSALKIDYFPLTETSVCVDDGKSIYYNQLLDSAKATKMDWNSGEQMRKVPQYQIGSVIQYNQDPPVVGKGSCIFMHIWKSPTTGTAGCIAMDENNLKQVLNWLDSTKQPVMVTLPKPAYLSMEKKWGLP